MILTRLEKLRKEMIKRGVKTYIIPGTDPHGSEYLPELWKRREWMSGFDGSAGDLVVNLDNSGLWTDSRYFLQAEKQLEGTGITLYKLRQPETPDLYDWVISTLKEGETAAIDPLLIPYREFRFLEEKFKANKVKLEALETNLVDSIREDSPSLPSEEIRVLEKAVTGVTAREKLDLLREEFTEKGADSIVLTELDQISWLFNLRSRDVTYNPVVISYAWVTRDKAALYVSPSKVTRELKLKAEEMGFEIRDYSLFIEDLKANLYQSESLMIDESSVSYCVRNSINSLKVIPAENPVIYMKAEKNQQELECFRLAHIQDGVAMVRFLKWVEETGSKTNELEASKKLDHYREIGTDYQGNSFSTISAFGPNGAIVHYGATESSYSQFTSNQLYLIDSGGQYSGALTDITRTLPIGEPTEEMKTHYTLVLKGLINLSSASFPSGTSGIRLDTLARSPLWNHGIDYMHGTGHGVGAGLNVHESPPSISFYGPSHRAIKEGMVNSIEPGIYLENRYGIRLENIVYAKKETSIPSENGEYLKFQYLTLCPFARKLIKASLLSADEKDYLNSYHQDVFQTLKDHLQKDEIQWLKEATAEI